MKKLTQKQIDIIIGTALGDLHIAKESKNAFLKFAQGNTGHKNYLYHLYEEFRDFVKTPPREKIIKSKVTPNLINYAWYFNTLSSPKFNFYADLFYKNKKKMIPSCISKWLTPRTIAYWYMDDGSMHSKKHRSIRFNTQGFEFEEVKHLCDIFEKKYSILAKPRSRKVQSGG